MNLVRSPAFITAALLSCCLPSQAGAAFRVVIDPGHGGQDLGTVSRDPRTGARVAEKDITLALARETALQLRSLGIETTLTRDTDAALDLPSRTAIANRLKADAFISIHLNSSENPGASATARGIETYILNTSSDASSHRLAHLENRVLGGSAIVPAAAKPSGESLEVALILKDLTLDSNRAESQRLACLLQENLVKTSMAPAPWGRGMKRTQVDRGVRHALFHVLLGADMPSALVEAGFLSHASDRGWLQSPRGRISAGRSLARGIKRFLDEKTLSQERRTLASCPVR